MEVNEITASIVDAAIAIHREVGPGLLESVYEIVLADELRRRGLDVQSQIGVPIVFRGRQFDQGYRLDLLVNDIVIVEIKSVEEINNVHKKQLLTYLRLTRKPVGLLLNFNVELMKQGIIRIVNNHQE
ncbi:hypothetical protein Pla175_00820 [Pirellulimonas nuda]|uniref:GxxExxY protein n=1 Tax=Pirellulimonas nuda TaxID=2528009 RepID=A0A518D5I5_9BACT|nr:GxxExxY protein [Pirellulimonas nuda]QDU86732.1 hypothetical protein Pla175_00820 [Pirellulimonas nuda]